MVDRNAIKINQFFIILLTASAYLANSPIIILLLSIIMLTGTLFIKAALFQIFYFNVLVPLGLVKQNVIEESAAPHRFAQGMGGTMMLFSYVLIEFLHLPVAGWSLAFLVMIFAFVNFAFGFCVGCFFYFQLEKAGIISN